MQDWLDFKGLGFLGLGGRGSGFRAYGLSFSVEVEGLGFRVGGSGLKVQEIYYWWSMQELQAKLVKN